jgi:hypothetical protein
MQSGEWEAEQRQAQDGAEERASGKLIQVADEREAKEIGDERTRARARSKAYLEDPSYTKEDHEVHHIKCLVAASEIDAEEKEVKSHNKQQV